MQSSLIYKNKDAVVKHLTDWNSILIEFRGLVGHESYKTIMGKAYDYLKQENLTRWISDTRQMKIVIPENMKWGNEHFLPMILSTTELRKVAFIIGEDAFAKATMDRITSEISKTNLPVRYFKNYDGIESWFNEE